MWIASKIGFFSIVQKGTLEGGVPAYQVRARVYHDLEHLLEEAGIKAAIQTWPMADYRYRVIVNRVQFGGIMDTLCWSVNYPNFKSEIAASPDQRSKLRAYSSFWGDMLQVQQMSEGEQLPGPEAGDCSDEPWP